MSKPIQDLRRDYQVGSLEAEELPTSPFPLFKAWFTDACASDDIMEPNAMVLATVSEKGDPSARLVLLKSYDERGFVFYTNYNSRKGHEIDAHGQAALVFWWDALERQVRVEGKAERIAPEESDAYFNERPRGSQLGAWASPQSEVIANRTSLHDAYTKHEQMFAEGVIPRPPHWGGFRVKPTAIEFWQGRSSRLHDRFVYRWSDEQERWTAPKRLAP
ncbi:MAG: pyridoxamine 5'-phosphate oxidase [Myxococcota bacterium]